MKHLRIKPTLPATATATAAATATARPRRAAGLQSLDETELARVVGGATDSGITAMDSWEAPVV